MAETSESESENTARENKTGMPDQLKAGLEQVSGFDLSHVRVHHNSHKPAKVDALAYAQGQDIHVGPGQDKHLPHEGWHVVQQMQGRVKPTMQAKGVSINDDAALEREADVMGAKALQMTRSDQFATRHASSAGTKVVQRKGGAHPTNWRITRYTAARGIIDYDFQWESSSGNLQDLSDVRVREKVSWNPCPWPIREEDMSYREVGKHYGRAPNSGDSGKGHDAHEAHRPYPALGADLDAALVRGSGLEWEMSQVFQYRNSDGEWTDIPGTEFVITRGLFRKTTGGFLRKKKDQYWATIRKQGENINASTSVLLPRP